MIASKILITGGTGYIVVPAKFISSQRPASI